MRKWGVLKKLGGDTGRTADSGQRDIRYHTTSCSAYKVEGWRRKEGTFGVMALVFQSNHHHLLSWRGLNICLPMGSSEQVPCFSLLVCAAFVIPIKLSLYQPLSFLTFTLPILSPSHCEGSEQVAAWCLVAGCG